MRIPRFLLLNSSSPLAPGENLVLREEDSYHLARVLRASLGQQIEVAHPECKLLYRCETTRIDEKATEARVLECSAEASRFASHLICALVKPSLCDLITEKSVELGIANLHFFQGERSGPSYQLEQYQKRVSRLRRVAEAAMKQSKCPQMPEIDIQPNLAQVLESIHGAEKLPKKDEMRLICLAPESEEEDSPETQVPTIKELLLNSGHPGQRGQYFFSNMLENRNKCVESYIIVGPEGGFAEEERKLALGFGYQAISIGAHVLRTETAAIVAGALSQLISEPPR